MYTDISDLEICQRLNFSKESVYKVSVKYYAIHQSSKTTCISTKEASSLCSGKYFKSSDLSFLLILMFLISNTHFNFFPYANVLQVFVCYMNSS